MTKSFGRLGSKVAAVYKPFRRRVFERDAARGFDALELLDLGRHLVNMLQRHLPEKFADAVNVTVSLRNPSRVSQRAVVDLRVHFVKSNGGVGIDIFKLSAVELAPRGTIQLRKTFSLADLTTRRHYPGEHKVDVQINGLAMPIGSFRVLPSR